MTNLVNKYNLRHFCISCVLTFNLEICDFCLEHSKFKILKMLDLQTKSAMDSTEPLVLL